ncbi:iron-containing redox enzyme family protein [Arthrobacter sp. PAMC25284]|uniref:iron-containing redox enzyme family protein n=1 Tax=Arthrobacter sp. PAMC25284 TaxID=2861279 RepID=UPI001C638F6C|nr:iron-containing redox enzyme family protein [Arthrobacter sp. PAMC25284]QYF89145.1 iron-containing redox enzyme family protein [Arthrobacter sp. PAMC25284]
MKAPEARGPVSDGLLRILAGQPDSDLAAQGNLLELVSAQLHLVDDIIDDEDIQLALFCLYELHYGGLEGVDDRWEWNPDLIRIRQVLEAPFEAALRSAAGQYATHIDLTPVEPLRSDDVAAILFELAAQDSGTGPSVARHVAKRATREQLREFLIHKSIYQLKEADPHTWAIPRLTGRAKAALVEIQADEYGGGDPDRMHSALFARTMRGLDLDDQYGGYVDSVPALSLASVNVMSLFGLNRRLRGAIAGHLAIYEMTSSRPNQLYGQGFRRHGLDAEVTRYFDEHVEADAVHEQIAGRDLAGGLVEAEPDLLEDVIFGATAVLAVDARLSSLIMDAWDNGRSSLRAAATVTA